MLLLINKYMYNNIQNTKTSHIVFELNCKFYFCKFFEKYKDFYFISKITKKLIIKLQKFLIICLKILYYIKNFRNKLKKCIKVSNYVISNKI